jgi:ATP-dependent exoDNAse (exonuclease V) beta subunit
MSGPLTLDLFDTIEEPVPRRATRALVLAAAGSGKTHRLTTELLRLLSFGVPPEEILASTFTRKAAGEILERVLLRLAAAASDPRTLLDQIRDGQGPSGTVDFAAILLGLTRNLHRLQVQTVDAFIYRVARAFALDLGLPATWETPTEPEVERLRSRAVEAAMRELDPRALTELVAQIGKGPADCSVHGVLLRGARDLHASYVALDPEVENPWGFEGGLDAFPEVDASERERLLSRLQNAALPHTVKRLEDTSWVKARSRAVRAIREDDWEEFATKGVAKAILEGKTDFSGKPIPTDLLDIYGRLLEMARSTLGRVYQRRVEGLRRFLPVFDRAFLQLEKTEGVYHFDDLNHVLLRSTHLAGGTELYYRLDGQVRHVLFDEFQDTSNAQWSALEPLVGEVLSGYEGERVALIVADTKQSIFGWRGGSPRLISHLQTKYALPAETLSRSRRSSSVVLGAVNRVFSRVAAAPILAEVATEVRAWASAFEEHQPAEERPGFVRLEAGPEEDEDTRGDQKPALLAYAAERARDLHRAAPGATLAVLTRTNAAAASLMAGLRRLGVEASEEGGVPVTDSAAVLAVLAALRLADHPADPVSRYLVAKTAVGELVGLSRDEWQSDARVTDVGRGLRERLLRDGYGPLLSRWLRDLAPKVSPRDRRRLRQLVELAFQWDERPTIRPSDFVAFASAARTEDPTGSAVRVMTVHKAKGLEFDIVLLPELDALKLYETDGSGFLPYRDGGTGPVKRIFPRVGREVRPLFPEVIDAESQQRERSLWDALSQLYVGMTRARHATHLIVSPEPDRKRTAARLVWETLAPDVPAAPLSLLWENGNREWSLAARRGRPEGPHESRPVARRRPAKVELAPATGRRSFRTRAPSDLVQRGRATFVSFFEVERAAAKERGALVHRWLEMIEWIEDGVPDGPEMLAAAVPILRDAKRARTLLSDFSGWIESAAIRSLLSRDTFSTGCRVDRELPFLVRDGGALLEGRVDRLIRTEGPDGVRLRIVDWKTDVWEGTAEGALALERTALYRPQMEAYRRAVALAEGVPIERVDACLAFVPSGVVIDLAFVPSGVVIDLPPESSKPQA